MSLSDTSLPSSLTSTVVPDTSSSSITTITTSTPMDSFVAEIKALRERAIEEKKIPPSRPDHPGVAIIEKGLKEAASKPDQVSVYFSWKELKTNPYGTTANDIKDLLHYFIRRFKIEAVWNEGDFDQKQVSSLSGYRIYVSPYETPLNYDPPIPRVYS